MQALNPSKAISRLKDSFKKLKKKKHTYFKNVTASGWLPPQYLKHGETRFVEDHFRYQKILTREKLTKNWFLWKVVVLSFLDREIHDFCRIYIFSAILIYFCGQNKISNKFTKKRLGEFFPCPEFLILKIVRDTKSYVGFSVSVRSCNVPETCVFLLSDFLWISTANFTMSC